MAQRTAASSTPRIGTWNVRFFPDSVEGTQDEPEEATDVPWLACAIASLDVTLLFVQEFKRTPQSGQKQAELLQRLNELTQGNWQLQLFECKPDEVQHSGFLYDAKRVTASNFREVWSLTPDPVCSNQVSPGFAGYFRITGGPDFHAVVVHLHTGEAVTSIERRRQSISALAQATSEAYALMPDTDIIFGGDFNTSGCDECDPDVSNEAEVKALGELVSAFAQPLRLLPASQSCSREDGPNSGLLDHFVVAASMQELASNTGAHVHGICEELKCDKELHADIDARDNLSDHCPLTIDLLATDDD